MKANKIILALAFILGGGTLWAQGSLEDYQRAYSMRQKYGMDKVLNMNVMPESRSTTRGGMAGKEIPPRGCR